MKIIARIYNGFEEKFGIPRQSGIVQTRSRIVFEKEYRNAAALKGLAVEGMSTEEIIKQGLRAMVMR